MLAALTVSIEPVVKEVNVNATLAKLNLSLSGIYY